MSLPSKSTEEIKIFCAHSPSRKDEHPRRGLESHLSVLKPLGVDMIWSKSQTKAEQDWGMEPRKHINRADIIVLLISPDFVSLTLENLNWSTAVNQVIKRCEEEEVPVIPVLLRPISSWQNLPFSSLEPLPKNRRAVTDWPNRDKAFAEVVQGIEERVNELKEYRQKLQEYQQYFFDVIQREYPLSASTCEYLNNFKQSRSLKDKDITPIEEQITQQKQKEYQQQLQQYANELFREIQREYPLRVQARERLKSLQKSLNLKDKDVQQITRQKNEEYKLQKQQKKLQQQQSGLAWLAGITVTALTGFLFLGHLDFSPKISTEDLFRQAYNKVDRGDYRGAIKDYTQIISSDSNYSDAYLERGNSLYYLKDYQAAIRDYTQVIRFAPNTAKAYYNRGVAYSDLGNKRKAVEDYQKAANLYQQQGQTDNYKNTLNELSKLQR